MCKPQVTGVKGLPAKRHHSVRRTLPQPVHLGLKPCGVKGIGHKRGPDRGHMDPDLMGATGLQPAGEGTCRPKRFTGFIVGDGGFAVSAYGKALPVGRVAAQRPINGACWGMGRSPYERLITPGEWAVAAMVGKLRGETLVGCIGFGHHHDAGGVLVEPVDDARAHDATDAGQAIPAVGEQRIDECPRAMAGRGMNHQAGRLVDDDEGGIFIDDVKRDGLWERLCGRRRGDAHRQPIARNEFAGRVSEWRAVEFHGASPYQRLAARARQVRRNPGEGGIGAAAMIHNKLHGVSVTETDEEDELDPAMERVRRKLARLLFVSTGIMVIGLGAVIAGIFYRVSQLDEGDEPLAPVALDVPANAILSASTSEDRLILTIGGDTPRIEVRRLPDGALIQTLTLTPERSVAAD